MAIIDLVKWNADQQTYAWKYPSEELSTWTQLIVSQSQEAMLVHKGEFMGPFGPGKHTLSTENYPIISKFFKLPFGGRSPFTAEVWFINKTMPLDVKWGTATPMQIQDPKYKIMLPVRAFGQYGVKIDDTFQFLYKLVGTVPSFKRDQLVSHFRGIVVSHVKTAIAQLLVQESIPVLDLPAHMRSLSDLLRERIDAVMVDYGVELVDFNVTAITIPEDDPALQKLKEALAKKAEMDIVGYSYEQERSFDTMEAAAGNEGSGQSGIMGAGIGLGMGFGLGGAMGGAANQMTSQFQFEKPAVKCEKCGAGNMSGAQFCSGCGETLSREVNNPVASPDMVACDKCGHEATVGSKFCPNCGDPYICCSSCGTDNPEDNLECMKCGTPMPRTCGNCNAKVSGEKPFCPHCGNTIHMKCSKCDTLILPDCKFCTGCGIEIVQAEEATDEQS